MLLSQNEGLRSGKALSLSHMSIDAALLPACSKANYIQIKEMSPCKLRLLLKILRNCLEWLGKLYVAAIHARGCG